MDKQEALQSVTDLARAGVVTRDEVIEAYQTGVSADTAQAEHRMNLSGVLSYLGGGIVVLGVGIFIQEHWETLTVFTRIVSTLGVGILAYWNGTVLSREKRYASLGLAFHLIAACVLPIGLFVVFDQAGFVVGQASTQSIIFAILTGFYLISYRVFDRTLFLFWSVVYVTLLFGSVTSYLGDWSALGLDSHFTSYQFLIIGLTYLALGQAFLERQEAPLTKYLSTFGLVFFFAAALELGGYSPGQNWFWELIYPVLALGATLLSVPLKSRVFLVIGALALIAYIFKITDEYFSDSLGWPLALVIAGLAMIAVGTLFVRLNVKRTQQVQWIVSCSMYKRVVVKVGSGVILNEGQFDVERVAHIIDQILSLREAGIEVIFITSGAVALGRGMLRLGDDVDSIVQKQVFASVGQVRLMSFYADLFQGKGYTCAQVLVTKEDFRDRQHYGNMKNCLENLLQDRVIPIVNENDVVAVTELIFTDNDELAGLVASQLDADAVIILTSVDGVLDGDPKDPAAKTIPEIDFSREVSFEKYITKERSKSGRGGMQTKFAIAKKLARQGIVTHIVNGKRQQSIVEALEGKSGGTKFVADKKVSATKRRLANSEGLARGVVTVNTCTEDVLISRKIVSLLPIGIVAVEGVFEKGDVVVVRSESGTDLGFGIVRYDSEKTKQSIGGRKMPVLIHYDYLFLT